MDIYLISDTEKSPEFPEQTQLLFLDKFTLDEFKQIDLFFSKKISFFIDFRLYHSNIISIYKQILSSNIYQSSKGKVSSILKIENICKKAILEKSGIIGFSD